MDCSQCSGIPEDGLQQEGAGDWRLWIHVRLLLKTYLLKMYLVYGFYDPQCAVFEIYVLSGVYKHKVGGN